ncbi:MAG: saccharopine dehydrogenase NADP-binding domain-containing protein [Rhodospirillales bacterium]|nr:saccharopine dehydrogenase NADP-binding domain-containing protein [Rhodospirillales bacterium]
MSARRFTVLVIGGYGVFGSRLCRLLAATPVLRVVVAGRFPDTARRLAQELARDRPDAGIEALRLDIDGELSAALECSDADVVIHAAGPFQGQDYRVARACIATGRHYIDLADGRDFVAGFAALDGAARRAGVLAVSGASSVPGLSGAVVAHLARNLVALEQVEIGITPGNRAPRGLAVVRAILGYTGRAIPVWTDGGQGRVYGWQDLRRRSLRLAGRAPLGARWFAACDVPDTALLPARYPGLRDVTFHAGLELAVLHLGLWLLSWPVRWRLLPGLAPLAPLARRLAALLEPFGTDRGGMFVEVSGRDAAGAPQRRRWTLIAEGGDGPFVPCLPAAILTRALAEGRLALRGARPCLDLFDLDDVATATNGLRLYWGEERVDVGAA